MYLMKYPAIDLYGNIPSSSLTVVNEINFTINKINILKLSTVKLLTNNNKFYSHY